MLSFPGFGLTVTNGRKGAYSHKDVNINIIMRTGHMHTGLQCPFARESLTLAAVPTVQRKDWPYIMLAVNSKPFDRMGPKY